MYTTMLFRTTTTTTSAAGAAARTAASTRLKQLSSPSLIFCNTAKNTMNRSMRTNAFTRTATYQRQQSYERVFEKPPLTPEAKTKATIMIAGAVAGLGALYWLGTSEGQANATADALHHPMSHPLVRSRVHATYQYVASGLGISAVTALLAFKTGAAYRIAALNPWVSLGVSLVGTIGTMMWTHSLPYDDPKKLPVWALSMSAFGLTLSPLAFVGGAIIMKAAMITGITVSSLSLVASTAPSETFLWMGGPLSIGLGLTVAAGVGSMFFPASPLLHNVVLYGGLGVFGLFVLYDSQRLIKTAALSPYYDPINESFHLYLDTINIFVRVVQILAMGGGGRRK